MYSGNACEGFDRPLERQGTPQAVKHVEDDDVTRTKHELQRANRSVEAAARLPIGIYAAERAPFPRHRAVVPANLVVIYERRIHLATELLVHAREKGMRMRVAHDQQPLTVRSPLANGASGQARRQLSCQLLDCVPESMRSS